MFDKLKKIGHKKVSIPMTPVCKRRSGAIDESTLVALNVTSNHVQPININPGGTMKLENISDNRQIDETNTVFAAFQQGTNSLQTGQIIENGYNAIEYVGSPVVAVHTDQHAKFSDELITDSSNVSFVEINGSNVKTNNTPLELYFDVLPTSSNSNNAGTSSYIPRQQEHQTPKAQILVRAYSDFLQSQENHQLHAIQVEASHQDDENNSEYSFRDMISSSISQLDETIPHTFVEYKKNIKMESPKKMQLHMQPNKQAIAGDIDNCKIINSHPTEIHSEFGNHDPHIQHGGQQDTRHQHYILQPTQQQQQYQVMPKYSQVQLKSNSNEYQMNTMGSKIIPGNTIIMQNVGNEGSPQLSNGRTSKEQDVHYSSESTALFMRNSHFNSENGAFFSRSGRLIRRRPEYAEYVNEENINHEILHESNEAHLSMDMNIHPCLKDKELIEHAEEMVCMPDNLHFDQADCESYIDGKASLPHKKRIQKNYKKAKKTIRELMCEVCGEQSMNILQFNEHKASHDNAVTKLYVCEICNKGCDTQLIFFDHLKRHYEPSKLHHCAVCDEEFESAQSLEQHSAIHTTSQLKCVACPKTFRKQSSLDGHMLTSHIESTQSTNNQVYQCSICSKEYNSQLAFDSHACPREQEDGSQLHCQDCYQYFKTKAKLLAHRKAEHKEEMNPKKATKKKTKNLKLPKTGYPCTLCTRTFIHKNSLNYHMRRHTGQRPHQCDLCGKAFFAASALKVHKRLHSGEKPYKCNDCGKFFRQWGDLKYHTSSVHSDTRQFQCEFCGKDFKRKYCLVVHRRIHTGEKNYKCQYCQKLFRASSYLQNHVRVHTGERPYPCPDCGKAFRVRSDMKRHRLTHLREPFPRKALYPPPPTSTSTTTTTKAEHAPEPLLSEPVKHDPGGGEVVHQRHTPSNEVQILQNDIGDGQQLIVTDNILNLTDQYPIRIMVSGMPTSHASQPPPAHRQSQISCVNMNSMATYTPESPNTNSNSASSISSEGIILPESTQQPVNLNVIPRSIAQPGVSGEHTVSIGADPCELISTGRWNSRTDDSVCVWTGVL